MWIFWAISSIPILIAFALFAFDRNAEIWEWVVSSVTALVLSGIFHIAVFFGQCQDIETWSGQITHATHFPYWYAEWVETYTTTDSEGNVEMHTRVCSEHHYEYWAAFTSTGEEHRINTAFFDEIKNNFGGKITVERPYKPDFERGDRNIYVAYNHSGFVYPTTTTREFINKTLNSPNLFKFTEIPKELSAWTLFEWPQNQYWNVSDRLQGMAKQLISIREWDLLNSRLGPSKKVNLIMVGFTNLDASIGQWQQAKWHGGKKNDLVLTFGAQQDTNKASWSYVFGWTESELCKQNLQSILVDNPINNDIIKLIEKEVSENYELKDWTKFDYIEIHPKTWHIVLFIGLTILIQIIARIIIIKNKYI